MVRIKHRYLLLNILYPDSNPQSIPSSTTTTIPAYLKFNGPTPQHISSHLFLNHLRAHITALFGDHGLGVSLSSLKLIYFSHATSTIILRVPRAHFRLTWAALTWMEEMPAPKGRNQGKPCAIRVVRVSGTIRKAEEELLRRSRREVVRAKLDEDGIKGGVLDRLAGGRTNTAAAVKEYDDTIEEAGIEDMDEEDSGSE